MEKENGREGEREGERKRKKLRKERREEGEFEAVKGAYRERAVSSNLTSFSLPDTQPVLAPGYLVVRICDRGARTRLALRWWPSGAPFLAVRWSCREVACVLEKHRFSRGSRHRAMGGEGGIVPTY